MFGETAACARPRCRSAAMLVQPDPGLDNHLPNDMSASFEQPPPKRFDLRCVDYAENQQLQFSLLRVTCLHRIAHIIEPSHDRSLFISVEPNHFFHNKNLLHDSASIVQIGKEIVECAKMKKLRTEAKHSSELFLSRLRCLHNAHV